MARYQIAGLQVEMAPAYPLLQRQAAAYEQPSDQPPDMTLTISDRRMAQKRQRSRKIFLPCRSRG